METSNSSDELVAKLTTSIVARNENFDHKVQGEQLLLDLRFRWLLCTAGLGRPDICLTWFDRLCQYHKEEHRHYHTLMHLEEMFMYLDLVVKSQETAITPQEEKALVLATFFHDSIYNVHSSTNEEDSAALFQAFMRESTSDGNANHHDIESFVVRCILATKKHEFAPENPPILNLFLDLDMSVLGKDIQAYMKYASLIRKEYSFVPHEVYCEKRAEILELFLKQPQIFGTHPMLQAFEQRARDNIASEIDMLRRGQIPG
jgi:predicted metal-dependent HD superfamily phosphohydrolase